MSALSLAYKSAGRLNNFSDRRYIYIFFTRNEGLPGVLGTREHGQFQLGNRGTKTKYLREQGNKKRFREYGNKALLKRGQQIEQKYIYIYIYKRRNRHLSCDISVCIHVGAEKMLNCGMSIMNSPWVTGCQAKLLRNWWEEGIQFWCEIAVATYHTEYGAKKSGADLEVVRSNPLN